MDGSQIGELEYENFNAAGAKIIAKGKIVHPGYAKGKMVNSMYYASEFINTLPRLETPEHFCNILSICAIIVIRMDSKVPLNLTGPSNPGCENFSSISVQLYCTK